MSELPQCCGPQASLELPRRIVLGGLGGIVGAAALAGCASTAPAVAPTPTAADLTRGLKVVLLGTQGGPPPSLHQNGIASALVVDGATYLVDAGRSAVTQYVHAGLKLASLAAVFITHLHADHVADYFNLFMLGGNATPKQQDSIPGPTPVYGPGPAGGLSVNGRTIKPSDPTPGLLKLTDLCDEAFSYSSNLFAHDSGVRPPRSLIDVHEIALPATGASYQNTAPAMKPFVVMEDSRVKVTAVLVPHGPVFPAFAYRFDTDHGAVTFSGDTTYTSNIPTLANGSDLLVHEAINVQGFQGGAALTQHLLTSHVEVQKVGAIAQQAGVEKLVLSHIGDLASPQIDLKRWTAWAQQGYDGQVRVGTDLAVIPIA